MTQTDVLIERLNARGFRLLQMLDALAVAAILVLSMVVRHGRTWPTYGLGLYALSFSVFTAVFLIAFYFGGLYEREPRLGSPPVLARALRVAVGAGGIVALLRLGAPSIGRALDTATELALPLPIPNLVALIPLSALAVATNRAVAQWNTTRLHGRPRVLVVGDDSEVALATDHLAAADDRADLVGQATSLDGLLERVEADDVTDVMLLSSHWLDLIYPDILLGLDARNVVVHQRVSAKETLFGLERVRQIGGMPFVKLRPHTLPRSRRHFKRLTDFVWLAVLAPVFIPALLFTAVYVRATVGRPVLFFQDRVGVDGATFRLVKFRTMREDAEEDGNPQLATRNDPRIVPAAAWLRATRLDELPQLWNILRGEMSLVGPRPERPELTEQFGEDIAGYHRRHELPPGLTGLAQIHGRYHTDASYKLGYDLQYLVNWSPALDVEIVLKTAWVVLARRL